MNRVVKLAGILMLAVILGGCLPEASQGDRQPLMPSAEPTEGAAVQPPGLVRPTPLPIRSPHAPGEIFVYPAQSGDTLQAVAAHFNTSVEEVRAANPEIPDEVTTLPPGYPLNVPAYYVPLTSSSLHILPDSEVVNGPGAVGFDVKREILSHPGYLSEATDVANLHYRPSWQLVEWVAQDYSVNPRLLLALLEHQSSALSNPSPSEDDELYPMGYQKPAARGLYQQLRWAAEQINNGYYGWRTGSLMEFLARDGRLVRPDPWQNAGTVALHALFAALYDKADFDHAVSPEGFYQTYERLFGSPFEDEVVLSPASLQQPDMRLPFLPGKSWSYTGGPHPSWGDSLPLGALDFAHSSGGSGCGVSREWIAAPADGLIVRGGNGAVLLDLDGDGDERTGWVVFFFHVAAEGQVAEGTLVKAGDLIGHPSCEGGQATGAHVHIARKYNGEWLPADGPIPFVLDGWRAVAGDRPYEGMLTRASEVVVACPCSSAETRISYHEP